MRRRASSALPFATSRASADELVAHAWRGGGVQRARSPPPRPAGKRRRARRSENVWLCTDAGAAASIGAASACRRTPPGASKDEVETAVLDGAADGSAGARADACRASASAHHRTVHASDKPASAGREHRRRRARAAAGQRHRLPQGAATPIGSRQVREADRASGDGGRSCADRRALGAGRGGERWKRAIAVEAWRILEAAEPFVPVRHITRCSLPRRAECAQGGRRRARCAMPARPWPRRTSPSPSERAGDAPASGTPSATGFSSRALRERARTANPKAAAIRWSRRVQGGANASAEAFDALRLASTSTTTRRRVAADAATEAVARLASSRARNAVRSRTPFEHADRRRRGRRNGCRRRRAGVAVRAPPIPTSARRVLGAHSRGRHRRPARAERRRTAPRDLLRAAARRGSAFSSVSRARVLPSRHRGADLRRRSGQALRSNASGAEQRRDARPGAPSRITGMKCAPSWSRCQRRWRVAASRAHGPSDGRTPGA